MEGRIVRGRGGSWKKGNRSGNDTGSEHRSRGRGGRGKRDHHRGRGRGGGSYASFLQRNQDEGEKSEDEDEGMEVFSRRKLESNWDRYKEAEREEEDDDVPTHRGTDYHVLLESAGDSFTQFRFTEEKDWEMDWFTASQMSAVILDLPALAQSLQQLPLHRRLNMEAELVQVSTPVDLPVVGLAPKQEVLKSSVFVPPSAAFKGLGTNQNLSITLTDSQVSAAVDDGDEELDQLLGLQKPVSDVAGQSVSDPEEQKTSPEKAPEELKEAPKVNEGDSEDIKDKVVSPPKSVKEEMTEEDLEDWLDSMIS